MLRPLASAFTVLLGATALTVACGPQQTPGDGDGDTDGDGDGDNTAGDGDGDGDGDPEECTYPELNGQPTGVGSVIPALVWEGAAADGGDFSLEDFHCSDEYADYDSITVIMVSTWCPNCPSYMQTLANQYASLEANNSLLVWMVMQNNQYAPASNQVADQYVTGYVGAGTGLRIGDASINAPGALNSMYTFVPNGFVIRKSDMKVIAHQESAGNFLPYVDVTGDLDADWSSGLAPFESQCGPDDEESYEPNDSPGQAAIITPGEFDGGICDQKGDMYAIELEGDWKIDLLFSHATGDLDLHRINEAGESLQQAWTTDDNEEMTGSGPALIAVVGYTGASAPYTFILTDLSE